MKKNKLRYWFLNIKIINGEYEYNSVSLHMTDGDEFDAEDWAKSFYETDGGEENEPGDGNFYFNGGEVCVSVHGLEEISKKDYTILRKYI